MKRYLVTSLVLVFVALSLAYPQKVSKSGSVAGQRRGTRRPPARPGTRPPVARAPAINYSKFSHATKKHQEGCNTCHKVPTSNWRKAGAYPDVADYPDHDTCVSCHRAQFFKGAKPAICSVCHSKVSPRDDVRFAFRNPAGKRQFLIEFPHDKHQDVIAKLFRGSPVEAASAQQPRFVRASFTSSSFNADDKSKRYNNCEICHGPQTAPAVAPAAGWTDGFVPDNQTLRLSPVNHASCFSCHWKSEQPINENCAGCHKLPTTPAIPEIADSIKRKSMKFRHGREQHLRECTECHINITKAATLRGLKPDVPISSCATTSCHANPAGNEAISKELSSIKKDKNFVCIYCHTSEIGRRDAPPSHALSLGGSPIRREDIK